MYRRLIRPIRKLLAHWQRRPLVALALLTVALTAVGGPAVCLLDCWLHELRAAQNDPQGLHQHHGISHDAADRYGSAAGAGTRSGRPVPALGSVPVPELPQHQQHSSGSDGNAPSALTIAILLTVSLLPAGGLSRRLLYRARLLLSSLAIPPPQRPPRYSMSFALGVA